MTFIEQERRRFHQALLAGPLSMQGGIPSIADKSQDFSVRTAQAIVEQLGSAPEAVKLAGQTAGHKFEELCAEFIQRMFDLLSALRPGKWTVQNIKSRSGQGISEYEQYRHLQDLQKLVQDNPAIAANLGNDYLIAPDIVVLRHPLPDTQINEQDEIVDLALARGTPLRDVNNAYPILHASVSCKWTLRSDRAQNARSEALNLLRNRKGRAPHIVIITAEPTPSRISSIALGTGDIDCVYHFALYEMFQAVEASGNSEALNILQIMRDGKRLRDISDLPFDLAV